MNEEIRFNWIIFKNLHWIRNEKDADWTAITKIVRLGPKILVWTKKYPFFTPFYGDKLKSYEIIQYIIAIRQNFPKIW